MASQTGDTFLVLVIFTLALILCCTTHDRLSKRIVLSSEIQSTQFYVIPNPRTLHRDTTMSTNKFKQRSLPPNCRRIWRLNIDIKYIMSAADEQ